jgi:hypothetical protein
MTGNIPATVSGGQPPALRDELRIFHAKGRIPTLGSGQEAEVTVRFGLQAYMLGSKAQGRLDRKCHSRTLPLSVHDRAAMAIDPQDSKVCGSR